MYTTTSKQILEPVAEAISALILINAEAESKSAPMPDLTEVSQTVESQALNLVGVGKSMMNPAEERLNKEMAAACDKVQKGAKALVETCKALKNSPYDKPSRAKLVEASKAILQGTTDILSAYDDSEVRKIVKLCQSSREQLKQLKSIFELNDLLKIIRPACQSLVDLTALAKRRVDEILFPALQARLRDDIENINRSSGLLVSSSKAVVQNSKNEGSIQSRDFCCDRLTDIISDIEIVVQIRDWSESAYTDLIGVLSEQRSQVYKQLISIMTATQEKDSSGLMHAIDQFTQTSVALMKNSADIVTYSQFSSSGKELKALISRIEKHQKEILDTAKECSHQPNNIDLQQKLYDKLNQASGLYANLESLSDQVAAAQIRSSLQSTANHSVPKSVLGNFYNAAKDGRPVQYKLASESFRKEGETLKAALNHAALLTQDADTFRAIRAAEKDFSGLIDQVIAAGKAVNENPGNTVLMDHFNSLVNAWEDRISRAEEVITTENAVFKPEDMIASDRLLLEVHFQNLQKSATGQDRVSFEMAVGGINSAIKRLVNTAKRELSLTGSPLQKKGLERKIEDLQSSITDLRDGTEKMFNDKKTTEVKAKTLMDNAWTLEKTLREQKGMSNQSLKSVGNLLPPPKSSLPPKPKVTPPKPQLTLQPIIPEGSSYIATIDGEEVEIVDSPAPEALSAEEAKENPLKAAATDLKVITSQWTTTENPLIQRSFSVALKMERLAIIYREEGPNDRKEMLDKSREILEDGKAFSADCKKIADSCQDMILKNQLLKSLEIIQTMTMQLKIVAAVKAAEPRDRDSEKQLILISQNLVNAYKQAIRAAESASIRAQRASSSGVAGPVVKFRKVMYTKLRTGAMSPKFAAFSARKNALAGIAA